MFKKKKSMDQRDQEQRQDWTEEELSERLNTDDSRPGDELLDDSEQPADNINNNNDESSRLRAECDSLRDKFLRQAAEFDNFRKRTARERLDLMQTAGKDIMQDMLEVVDDSDRAMAILDKSDDVAAIKEGMHLIFQKLKSTLQAKGLKEMNAIGQEFDPELHEAIAEIPAPAPEQQGKVLDVVQPGYYMNDKIIRHAKVVVGK